MSREKSVETPKNIAHFVECVRQRRKALKLTQSDLAGLCGITKEGLSRIERGDVEPKLGTIMKLVKLLSGDIEVKWK